MMTWSGVTESDICRRCFVPNIGEVRFKWPADLAGTEAQASIVAGLRADLSREFSPVAGVSLAARFLYQSCLHRAIETRNGGRWRCTCRACLAVRKWHRDGFAIRTRPAFHQLALAGV
jgi:hypothetical protein